MSTTLRGLLLAVITILTATAFLTTAAPATAAPSFVTGTYTWYQGQPTRQLLPVSDHVCVLTRVGGNFRGSGESVRLYHEGGWWKLGGTSSKDGVHATATCFGKAAFTFTADGPWISNEQAIGWRTGTKCINRKLNGEPGDAATYLTGLTGDFAGRGEYGFINQSESGTAPSQIELNACQDHDTYYVRAHAFVAGNWGRVANFIGPGNDTPGPNIQYNKQFGRQTIPSSSTSYAVMAPVDKAMCYLKGVQGKFRGGGEYAEIAPRVVDGVLRWVLTAHRGSDGQVATFALCYARNQG